MALLDSVGRLAASMTDILQTRLALASLEIEEELQRFLQLLLWSLAAFFCACFAVVLLAVLLIALFWDHYRLPLIGGLITAFGGASYWMFAHIRHQLASKPRLLQATLDELEKDAAHLRGAVTEERQENAN